MEHYLVLASFMDERLADLFANQMSLQANKPIDVSRSQVGNDTAYRVILGPYDEKLASIESLFVGLGLNQTWWLSIDSSQAMKMVPETMLAEMLNSEKELRMPLPGEHYLEFCAMRANGLERDEFCSDDQVAAEVAKYFAVLSMSERDYVSYCISAPGRERPVYCSDQFWDKKGFSRSAYQLSALSLGTR